MSEQNITIALNANGTVAVTEHSVESGYERSIYPFAAARYADNPEYFERVTRYGILSLLMGPEDRQ